MEIDIYEERKKLEDALATDGLFVEYFNHYLSLPTFPEKLCFNKDTGGFEVVNNAHQDLSKKIKAAVRSSKRTPKIYRVAKHHSFVAIPLIPIEDEVMPDLEEIDTSFIVQALNKEQGIEWIKKERLPSFLESDCYLEYRLAKLVSQAQVQGKKGQFVTLRIDHAPRPKKRKDSEEDRLREEVEKEKLLKDCYVCMGNAQTTDTEAWVSQARINQKMNVTPSTPSLRPVSAVSGTSFRRPYSARPMSALSSVESMRRTDSGYNSPRKGSAISGGRTTTVSMYSINDIEEDSVLNSRLFEQTVKPVTPRPTETVCIMAEPGIPEQTNTVYIIPEVAPREKPEDNESNASEASVCSKDSETLTFKNIDEMGSVITGTVLRYSLANVMNTELDEVSNYEDLQSVFPDKKFMNLTMDDLDRVSLCELEPDHDQRAEEELAKVLGKKKEKKKGGESDDDSLLDSEEDYEEADSFFRRHKFKLHDLVTRKGIEEFQKFLTGTVGEKNWKFWLDIDRGHFMKTYQQQQNYLNVMRDKYQKHGALMELPQETKQALHLTEPSNWTLERLFQAQNIMVEPLVLYWAPRFLLKQKLHTDPNKNPLYLNQRHCRPKTAKDNGPFPDPPVISLLPLRPKSCAPRLRTTSGPEITPAIPEPAPPVEKPDGKPRTQPTIGWKRRYHPSAMKFANGNIPKFEPQDREQTSDQDSDEEDYMSVTSSAQGPSKILGGVNRSKVRGMVVTPNVEKIETKSAASETSRSAKSSAGSRAKSSSSVASEKSSQSSVFFGGQRMEAMLQALGSEGKAGDFFKKYLYTTGNTLWLYCIDFWHDIQEYHKMFYTDSFDHFALSKKAQSINAFYIVESAQKSLKCTKAVRRYISSHVNPPFEELFDPVEESVITTLHSAWLQMNMMDSTTFQKIELVEVKRHLETKNKYVINLQRKGLIRQRSLTPDDPMEGYEDPVYDPILLDRIPEEFREFTLDKLVHNRIELERFRQFLADNYASMDLMCWMDIEAFRRISHSDEKKRDQKAKDIRTKYLTKKYFFGPNSPAGKEGQETVMAAGGGWGKILEDRPPTQVLLEAQKYVAMRLEKKWLPLFLATDEFAERQHPQVGMDDVVDDVMLQRKKKSAAVQRMLESKWVSSSKDIIAFRKMLINPVSSKQFRRYVSIKGDSLENDVLFWQEVQKFKDMYHLHSEDSQIINKINNIINCFIDSQIPPSLQIDIPIEQAEKIIDKRREMGPYVFREAQLSVFRMLFAYWNDFSNYRSSVADDKILPTIERLRRRARQKERLKQKKLVDKKEREESRRKAMGLPRPGDDDVDAGYDPFGGEGDDAVSVDGERDRVSWSYSSYLEGLDREETLNNVDESTFSSLSETGSVKGTSRPESRPASSSKSQKSESQSRVDGEAKEDGDDKENKGDAAKRKRRGSSVTGNRLKDDAKQNGKKLSETRGSATQVK
ncbi:regulator of G-protein signaling 22-like isoform X3 [Lineus longissimus]|uniref:regulator of G-protein signaling 22-like isoform X3 n=1 Tax=Lineus longissimus TaxID=88925 RepID=UPI00315DD8B8